MRTIQSGAAVLAASALSVVSASATSPRATVHSAAATADPWRTETERDQMTDASTVSLVEVVPVFWTGC